MSRTPAFRTYTFISGDAAIKFSPLFKNGAASMQRDYDTLVKGYWISKTNPAQVYALVEYPAGSDPEKIRHDYTTSETFKNDCEGNDLMAVLAGCEEVLVVPIPL